MILLDHNRVLNSESASKSETRTTEFCKRSCDHGFINWSPNWSWTFDNKLIDSSSIIYSLKIDSVI